jgi:hypothetical protein
VTTGRIRVLQPAPHARAVATVNITELALEIRFLAGHNAVADGECEGHKRRGVFICARNEIGDPYSEVTNGHLMSAYPSKADFN